MLGVFLSLSLFVIGSWAPATVEDPVATTIEVQEAGPASSFGTAPPPPLPPPKKR
jgi:hypothetical protein